ncbi:hypothetical protein JRQ81_007975, partial [Phrynocephalus forsythii]
MIPRLRLAFRTLRFGRLRSPAGAEGWRAPRELVSLSAPPVAAGVALRRGRAVMAALEASRLPGRRSSAWEPGRKPGEKREDNSSFLPARYCNRP